MNGRVLDSEEIQRLHLCGWSIKGLANHFNVPVISIIRVLGPDPDFDDPGLRARWRVKLPAMCAAIRDEVLRDWD
jgi:hypothetical protein